MFIRYPGAPCGLYWPQNSAQSPHQFANLRCRKSEIRRTLITRGSFLGMIA